MCGDVADHYSQVGLQRQRLLTSQSPGSPLGEGRSGSFSTFPSKAIVREMFIYPVQYLHCLSVLITDGVISYRCCKYTGLGGAQTFVRSRTRIIIHWVSIALFTASIFERYQELNTRGQGHSKV